MRLDKRNGGKGRISWAGVRVEDRSGVEQGGSWGGFRWMGRGGGCDEDFGHSAAKAVRGSKNMGGPKR